MTPGGSFCRLNRRKRKIAVKGCPNPYEAVTNYSLKNRTLLTKSVYALRAISTCSTECGKNFRVDEGKQRRREMYPDDEVVGFVAKSCKEEVIFI